MAGGLKEAFNAIMRGRKGLNEPKPSHGAVKTTGFLQGQDAALRLMSVA